MAKASSRKKKPAPRKSKGSMTRKASLANSASRVEVSLKKMLEPVMEDLRAMNQQGNQLAEAHNQLWRNQRLMNSGLVAAEQHAVLSRRLMHDMVHDAVHLVEIHRRHTAGSEQMDVISVIDWDWYIEQLELSPDRQEFMTGVVLEGEFLEKKRAEFEERQEQMRQEAKRAREEFLSSVIDKALAADPEAFHEAASEEGSVPDEKLMALIHERVKVLKGMEEVALRLTKEKMARIARPEEMQESAQALLDQTQKVADEVGKMQRGESYDKTVIEQAQAVIDSAEGDYPEGASIFGG